MLVMADMAADLRGHVSESDSYFPLITLPNCTLIARSARYAWQPRRLSEARIAPDSRPVLSRVLQRPPHGQAASPYRYSDEPCQVKQHLVDIRWCEASAYKDHHQDDHHQRGAR
jgi:hypothetical protein